MITMLLHSINLVITINFGINPINGGIPARDNILIDIKIVIVEFILNMLYIDLIVFELIIFIIKKIGITIIVYIMKYIIQNIILLIDNIDVIHPICPIEEYAKSGRRWVWFIPSIPPISAFILAVIIIIVVIWNFILNIVSNLNGASFCHVDKIKQFIQDKDAITDGYQKWHGAIPSLINIAIIIIDVEVICINGWYIVLIPNSIIIDPRACDKKYLIDASVSWFFLALIISGINLNILISSIIHAINQLGLIIVNTVLIINNRYIAHINGVWLSIKIWRSWTPY